MSDYITVLDREPNYVSRVLNGKVKLPKLSTILLDYLVEHLDFEDYRPIGIKRKELSKMFNLSEQAIRDGLIRLEELKILIRKEPLKTQTRYSSNYTFILNRNYNAPEKTVKEELENYIRDNFQDLLIFISNNRNLPSLDSLIKSIQNTIITSITDIEATNEQIIEVLNDIINNYDELILESFEDLISHLNDILIDYNLNIYRYNNLDNYIYIGDDCDVIFIVYNKTKNYLRLSLQNNQYVIINDRFDKVFRIIKNHISQK